eukprot:gb/GEZN01008949.1/.p1 GENE.gb/GEZN01008949.1/~~gb/GEZN01008949.1/.p1  ORF type:complete len:221 (+),score=37.77 gb/GEZN01008949.1/:70-732(+)
MDISDSKEKAKTLNKSAKNMSSDSKEIELFIETLEGRTVLFSTKSSDSVGMLKKKLQTLTGSKVPLELQCLIFSGNQLLDGATLADSGVENEKTLRLVMRPGVDLRMPIFVQTLTGITMTLEVRCTDTVSSVKRQLRRRTGSVSKLNRPIDSRWFGQNAPKSTAEIWVIRDGIPTEKQRLTFAGKEMEDGKTLAEYGVQRQSTLQLALRLRAGAVQTLTS